ncbi:hypothetical protein NDU88_001826 [Pleurodeles waltl]|uniref:Uncharacterized protein n=1 Tax=Pleurodeles waltl TaxID=8319 RepID=A0AAV7TLE4_PLEWA|nr:hypothetical protein NDU88_001826 [Pleurodeles waltl]
MTRAFLESLFFSLRDHLQGVKIDLLADMRDKRHDLDDVGEWITSLEDRDDASSEELERLQQEILQLQDQQLDLQAHMEDLENRSRQNNICIRSIPTETKGTDLHEYVTVLFTQVLGDPPETGIKLDRVHRVGAL